MRENHPQRKHRPVIKGTQMSLFDYSAQKNHEISCPLLNVYGDVISIVVY